MQRRVAAFRGQHVLGVRCAVDGVGLVLFEVGRAGVVVAVFRVDQRGKTRLRPGSGKGSETV